VVLSVQTVKATGGEMGVWGRNGEGSRCCARLDLLDAMNRLQRRLPFRDCTPTHSLRINWEEKGLLLVLLYIYPARSP